MKSFVARANVFTARIGSLCAMKSKGKSKMTVSLVAMPSLPDMSTPIAASKERKKEKKNDDESKGVIAFDVLPDAQRRLQEKFEDTRLMPDAKKEELRKQFGRVGRPVIVAEETDFKKLKKKLGGDVIEAFTSTRTCDLDKRITLLAEYELEIEQARKADTELQRLKAQVAELNRPYNEAKSDIIARRRAAIMIKHSRGREITGGTDG